MNVSQRPAYPIVPKMPDGGKASTAYKSYVRVRPSFYSHICNYGPVWSHRQRHRRSQ